MPQPVPGEVPKPVTGETPQPAKSPSSQPSSQAAKYPASVNMNVMKNERDNNACSVTGMRQECDSVKIKECSVSLSNPEVSKIKAKNPYSNSKSTNFSDRPISKAKYRVKNISRGTFSLSPVKGSPVSREKSENPNSRKSSNMKTHLEFFRKLEKSSTTTNISLNSSVSTTPGKRKLQPVVEGKRSPISLLKVKSSDSTRDEAIIESPAKRQRSCRHRGVV